MVSFNLNKSEKCLLQSIYAKMSYVENDSVSQQVNHILEEALSSSVITDVNAEILRKLLPKLIFLPDSNKENICLDSNNNEWDIGENECNVINRRQQLAEINNRFSNWLLMQYVIYQKQNNDNRVKKRKLSLIGNKKKSINNKGAYKKKY